MGAWRTNRCFRLLIRGRLKTKILHFFKKIAFDMETSHSNFEWKDLEASEVL